MKMYLSLFAFVFCVHAATAQADPRFTGKVGINSSSPTANLSLGVNLGNKKLFIYDSGTEGTGFGQSNSEFRIFGASSEANHISFGKYTFTSDLFTEQMRIENGGNVAIGTTDSKGYKLAVNGTVIANEVTIKVYPWSDYVFYSGYRLRPLSEVESFIRQHHHLPEVPSAEEVKNNGVKVGETDALLLKKIEELTLYLIEKDKEVKDLKQQVADLQGQQQQIDYLQQQLELLSKTLDRK